MRMVGLPRRHLKLGAKWGRSDDAKAGPGDQPDGSDLKRGQQQPVISLPG